MKRHSYPPQSLVRSLFDYDPETGKLLWKVKRRGGAVPGMEAGSIRNVKNSNIKYRKVHVFRKLFFNHIIIWIWMEGSIPDWCEIIDHKDRDGLNNKWDNLRPATQSQNCFNSKMKTNNQSGLKGIYYVPSRNSPKKWRAEIMIRGKKKRLGSFFTKEDAHEAYKQAAIAFHGEFFCAP